MEKKATLAQMTDIPLDDEEEDGVQHYTFSQDPEDSRGNQLIVIPLELGIDLHNIKTEYVEVQIQVEPERNAKTPPIMYFPQSTNNPKLNSKTASELGPVKMLKRESFKCDVCGKMYSSRNHLQRHTNLHTREHIYKCEICGKSCLDKSTLQRHRTIHSGERPHPCTMCQKSFSTLTSLKRHTSVHVPELRNHVCEECNKRFPDRSSLKKHARIHTGVKPYVCTLCAKSFFHIGDLNMHKKCHEAQKPFACDVCQKEFTRQNNMLRHREIHFGIKNYECDDCGVCYQHSGSLTRHILAAHPNKKKIKKLTKQSELNFTSELYGEEVVGMDVPKEMEAGGDAFYNEEDDNCTFDEEKLIISTPLDGNISLSQSMEDSLSSHGSATGDAQLTTLTCVTVPPDSNTVLGL